MPLSRRSFLAVASAPALADKVSGQQGSIDRRALVSRHDVHLTSLDARSPLSVGNGEFAFTVDITGLQSLPAAYEKTTPLCTQSQWGWHSSPIPDGLAPSQLRMEMFDTYGRPVGYATSSRGQETLFNWLRQNPHRLNLVRAGLLLDGNPMDADRITSIDQTLRLWDGVILSRFALDGSPIEVVTCCHPSRDSIGVSIKSPLLAAGRLSIAFDFPYGSPQMNASDWNSPDKHTTKSTLGPRSLAIRRQLDSDVYLVRLDWTGTAQARPSDSHRVVLTGKQLDFTCEFAPKPISAPALPASAVRSAAAKHWNAFWSGGAAVDLSGSTDQRASELERRIVLSQYLTAIQCAGSAPPQETGLTCNSWYGKFHLEMHWWHAAHFPLWSRAALLERSLPWYNSILPVAIEKARKQGYDGARWPKMTDLEGRDSPSAVGEMLTWQQPHPISLAELCYQADPTPERLKRYADVVMKSAEFMADYAVERDGRYVLGPPLIPAQENHPPRETWNPTYELEYWREALEIAQTWRERLKMKRHPKWDDVRARLSKLPVKNGVYLAHENCPQTFTERNRDHPSMLAAYGVLKGERIDRETMRRTLKKVMSDWRWADTWGWDFPMVAMTAAKLGEPDVAINALFVDSPKNLWLPNGHNWQRANLPLYLPGNGALLIATAMMAASWNGFPKDRWQVRHEKLRPML